MPLDAVLLSRLQFFWVIALHILLPAFTVGLASYIAVLEGLNFTTQRFGAGGYFMWRFLRAGPTDKRPDAQRRIGTPARPLSAAEVD